MILKRGKITIEKISNPQGSDDCKVYYDGRYYCHGNWEKARDKFRGCYIVRER